jgi:hypothetical protein
MPKVAEPKLPVPAAAGDSESRGAELAEPPYDQHGKQGASKLEEVCCCLTSALVVVEAVGEQHEWLIHLAIEVTRPSEMLSCRSSHRVDAVPVDEGAARLLL